jgi:biotin synthase
MIQTIPDLDKTNKIEELQKKIATIYQQALPDLIFQAQTIHRANNDPNEVQFCTLSSIKTGACPEDCGYCSQSARYNTGLEYEPLQDKSKILDEARSAKEKGSTRFCMGAAWREVPQGKQFDQVVEMVSEVKAMGLEPCVTLGMLSLDQAKRLKDAGLHSYNHNLDTSPEHYSKVITTRTYADRLNTIANVQSAGIDVCCGGILGMGESQADRIALIAQLASMDPQPSSVPINVLVPIAGTPLESAEPLDKIELVRTVATTRIMLPKTRVRLSAGRYTMTDELQALCFIAGANSIHTGDKLLTTPLAGQSKDHDLMNRLGMHSAS